MDDAALRNVGQQQQQQLPLSAAASARLQQQHSPVVAGTHTPRPSRGDIGGGLPSDALSSPLALTLDEVISLTSFHTCKDGEAASRRHSIITTASLKTCNSDQVLLFYECYVRRVHGGILSRMP